jgi:hypothetical protein
MRAMRAWRERVNFLLTQKSYGESLLNAGSTNNRAKQFTAFEPHH